METKGLNMVLNDAKIKSIIRRFQEQNDNTENTLQDFRKETELYIYNFPRLAFQKDADICADFYLYVLERLVPILRNYPLPAELQFKTWFNYVLKNQFLNFWKYRKNEEIKIADIDDYEDVVSSPVPDSDQSDPESIKYGLLRLPENDRILLKLYYMPEKITPEEIRFCADYFMIPVSDILDARKSLLDNHNCEILNIRESAEKIAGINSKILELKTALYPAKNQEERADYMEKNNLLLKIARLEASRFKIIRKMEAPDKESFLVLARLFQNREKARLRLDQAKKRLKFELLKLTRQEGGN